MAASLAVFPMRGGCGMPPDWSGLWYGWHDTWQEEMATKIVGNRGAIVTGCGGCGKSKILQLVKNLKI